MLTHLRISGLALLDDVELELTPGLQVFTGETGAGKSLLVQAVALLRGDRATTDVVRSGAAEARVEARFALTGEAATLVAAKLETIGVAPVAPMDGGPAELVVRRHIGARGRAYLNDVLVTATKLGEVMAALIDLAGQHEHQTLTQVAAHRSLLDRFGVPAELSQAMTSRYEVLRAASSAYAATMLDERTRDERADFLRFQLRELDEIDPRPDEEAALQRERERLRAAEKLAGAAARAEQALYAREGSICEELGMLGRQLDEAGRADAALAALARELDQDRAALEDLADRLRRYGERVVSDPERLVAVEDRLDRLRRLMRKHGPSFDELLTRRRAMAEELRALETSEARRRDAGQALERARADAAALAGALGEARRGAARRLAKAASRALGELGMAGARLLVDVRPNEEREGIDPALLIDGRRLGPFGWDRVEFLLAANPGEEPRPLARIASGGELSRAALALKQVLGEGDAVSTHVFDEIDAGIGGTVADIVGRQLGALATRKQVLCVTHLSQVAAHAQAHFRVAKHTAGGRTVTGVARLDENERIEELARMVGGAHVTAKTRAHAEELIDQARRRPTDH